MLLPAFSLSASTVNNLQGDLNSDGMVDVADILSLIHYVLKGEWPPVQPSSVDKLMTVEANGVSFNMVYVEPGSFVMGALDGDPDAFDKEYPSHQVSLSGFYIAQTEVTQELWQAVMGYPHDIQAADPQCPVDRVAWTECQTFITRLNELTGKTFRLPTEAEWEFAARGGVRGHGYPYSGSAVPDDVAWYSANALDVGEENPDYGIHPVAMKMANKLGLYDMSGNVYEWCQDRYGAYEAAAQTDPTGPVTGTDRVYRGGSWAYDARHCRVTYRNNCPPAFSIFCLGFRLAM